MNGVTARVHCRSIWIKGGARLIRVLHPVDAVPVSQVRVPLLVVIAGVRRLVSVGGGGGVDWKTRRGSHLWWAPFKGDEFRGHVLRKMEENSTLLCSSGPLTDSSSLAASFSFFLFSLERLTVDVSRQVHHHGPGLTGLNVEHHLRQPRKKLATPAISWCTVTLSPHVCSVLRM